MRNPVRQLLPVAPVACLATLLLVSSCKLLNEPACPDPPYFPFAAADKQWQSFAEGDEWVFENQRQQRRTYRIKRIYSSEKSPWYVGTFTERIGYYEDYWGMSWGRTDSAGSAGYCQLRRIPKKDPSQSALVGEFYWSDYLGQANNTGGLYAGHLDFDADLSVISFQTILRRGVSYSHITRFQSSNLAISRAKMYGSTQKAIQVDYDQRAGVIGFVLYNGDKWERVP